MGVGVGVSVGVCGCVCGCVGVWVGEYGDVIEEMEGFRLIYNVCKCIYICVCV